MKDLLPQDENLAFLSQITEESKDSGGNNNGVDKENSVETLENKKNSTNSLKVWIRKHNLLFLLL